MYHEIEARTGLARASRKAAPAAADRPAEPAGRARITELYLAGRGISHEQWGAYRAVADNLWSGDQPKLAEQALRMAAEGLSRDVILDKLVQDG